MARLWPSPGTAHEGEVISDGGHWHCLQVRSPGRGCREGHPGLGKGGLPKGRNATSHHKDRGHFHCSRRSPEQDEAGLREAASKEQHARQQRPHGKAQMAVAARGARTDRTGRRPRASLGDKADGEGQPRSPRIREKPRPCIHEK